MPWACSSAAGADAGELQDLRRADRAGGEHDLATRRHPGHGSVRAPNLDAGRAPHAIARLDAHPLHVRVGEHGQVAADAGPAAETPWCLLQRTPRRWFIWK